MKSYLQFLGFTQTANSKADMDIADPVLLTQDLHTNRIKLSNMKLKGSL